jgi:hypothetical protein
LSLETQYPPWEKALAFKHACIIYQEFAWEIIGTIDYKIITGNNVRDIFRIKESFMHPDVPHRDSKHLFFCSRFNLMFVKVGCEMNNLPLKVGHINNVIIGQPDGTPVPAAARYRATGEPSPPTPATRTFALIIFPGPPVRLPAK